MNSNAISLLSRKAIAAVFTVAFAATLLCAFPAGVRAYAADQVALDCGNGWVLACAVEDDQATVVSYEFKGSSASDLSIPETLSYQGRDIPIVRLGEAAFKDCTSLRRLSLPDNLKYVEASALLRTSLQGIAFGTGLEYIEDNGVARNVDLTSISFADGCHPEYFSDGAFSGNSALVEMEIPGLRGRNYTTAWTPNRIGAGCFNNCSSLEKIIYDPDTDEPKSYYTSGNNSNPVYSGCPKLKIVAGMSLSTPSSNSFSATANAFYAVYFYESEEAANNDAYRDKCTHYAIVDKGVSIMDISAGELEATQFYDASRDSSAFTKGAQAAIPKLSDFGVDDAKYVWGFSDDVFSSASSTLDGALSAYPVSKANMGFAYVSSPEIRNYSANGGMGTSASSRSNDCFFRLRDNNTTDLSTIEVLSIDGELLDSSLYTLYFRKGTQIGVTGMSWGDEFTDIKLVNVAGTYSVCAVGRGAYAGTSTDWVNMYVRRYDGTLLDYSTVGAAQASGRSAYDAAKLLDSHRFVVVAPDKSWQASLIATGLAGAGGGLAVFSDGTDSVDRAFQAISQAQVNYLIFLGSKSEISQAAITRAQMLYTSGAAEGSSSFVDVSQDTYASTGDSYASALACSVYETYKRTGPRLDDPFEWGPVAVLVSESAGDDAMAIAQYAYQSGAAVFFTNASGELSARTKADLADFETVVVAGGEGELSAAAFEQARSCVKSQTATRVLASESSYDNSMELAGLLLGGDDALPQAGSAASAATVCLADAVNPSCVCAGAQYAALAGGILIACKGSVDLKGAVSYLDASDPDSVKTVSLVGPLQSPAISAADRVKDIWLTSRKGNSALESGDTFASGDVMLRIGDGSQASVAGLQNALLTKASIPASATLGNAQYQVTGFDKQAFASSLLEQVDFVAGAPIAGIPEGLFESSRKLKAITLPAGITSIGPRAFSQCSALASVDLSSTLKAVGESAFAGCALKSITLPTSTTSIGASAFAGCTKLKSASIKGKVKTVAASVFDGCSSLTTVALPSTVTGIGKRSFAGCALKSVTLPASLTSIGASAYANCTKLATFKTNAKVKSIGASAFAKCTKLKTLTVNSGKLTKAGVKKALTGSSVKTVKLASKAAKAKLKKYKKYFAKANSGKKIAVKR